MSQISSTSGRPSDCVCDYQYKKRPKLKLAGQTTMKQHFKPYKIEKPIQYEPIKVQKKSYDPQLLQSSYKNQYKKPQIKLDKNDNIGTQYQYKPKKAPFYSDTQYKKSFQPVDIKIQKQPQYQYKPKNTKFQGTTTYGSQYKQKIPTQDLVLAGQESLQSPTGFLKNRPKIPFEGKTSYQQTFTKYDVKPQKQPQYQYQPKNTKFQGESSYKTSFKQFGQQAYKSDIDYCPIHPDRIATKIK